METFKTKFSYILKQNEMLLTILSKTSSALLRAVGKFIKIKENRVLITANSMGYNDSPRVIFKEIMEQEVLSHLEIIWALKDEEMLPKKYRSSVTVVKPDTPKYFRIALSSKYWISSVNIERGLSFKKAKTIFLNTWHGIPIKTVGNAVKNRSDFDWRKTDIVCYSNEKEKEIYKRDFKATEDSMIASGLPRNDKLYNLKESKILELKKSLGLDIEKKIILYAPTWRDSDDMGKNYKFEVPIDWKLWQEMLGDDYIILLRTHPYVTKLMNVEFNDFVLDYSKYPVINHLLAVSDILISDYSSVIYDYSILEKPIICYAYDYEDYKNSRGLYFDLEKEIPSGVFKTERQVLEKILNMDYKKEIKNTKKLKEKRLVYGGSATKICIDALFGFDKNE